MKLVKIVDKFQRWVAEHEDEQTGVFARQLVTETLSELFRHEFQETKWANGEHIPIDGNLSDGATEYSYNELIHTGRAKVIADDATDIPKADVKGKQTVAPVKTVACCFEYSTQEVRTARMQGMFDMPTEKSLAAREAHDFALNDFIRDGVPEAGLLGAVNHPNIIVQTAANGDWDSTATAAEIISDFTTAANTIISQSNGVEVPNTALFPIDQYTRISTLDKSADSDTTVLNYLRMAFPWITTWDWDADLATSSGAGGPAVLIYKKDPTRMRAVQPMTLSPTPPEQRGLVFKVALESRFGGVMAPKPRAMTRVENV